MDWYYWIIIILGGGNFAWVVITFFILKLFNHISDLTKAINCLQVDIAKITVNLDAQKDRIKSLELKEESRR